MVIVMHPMGAETNQMQFVRQCMSILLIFRDIIYSDRSNIFLEARPLAEAEGKSLFGSGAFVDRLRLD